MKWQSLVAILEAPLPMTSPDHRIFSLSPSLILGTNLPSTLPSSTARTNSRSSRRFRLPIRLLSRVSSILLAISLVLATPLGALRGPGSVSTWRIDFGGASGLGGSFVGTLRGVLRVGDGAVGSGVEDAAVSGVEEGGSERLGVLWFVKERYSKVLVRRERVECNRKGCETRGDGDVSFVISPLHGSAPDVFQRHWSNDLRRLDLTCDI
jgi:hypothetical protein